MERGWMLLSCYARFRIRFTTQRAGSLEDLIEVYRRVLLARAAEDVASQRAAFRLRYNVYCVERGFEDISRYPERMEWDSHDEHARHVLVRARSRPGGVVGASRLVVDTACQGALPIESHGSVSVCRQLAYVREHPDTRLAEVSRLAVTREFAEVLHPAALPARLRSQHVTLGLLALLFQQSWHAGVTHWVALLETTLLRALARFGFHCHPIGTVIEHRGARQPVIARLADLWGGVRAQGQPLAALASELGVPCDAQWSLPREATADGKEMG